MPHHFALADALRAAGLRVAEVDGWRTRGSSTFTPKVVIAHHTAGAATGNMPSLNLLVKGRSDLPGPLCQVALGRDGTAYVVAAGRANHAGKGGWRGVTGNSNAWGIEAENTGRGQAWTPEQLRAYPTICAVLCKLSGIGASAVCGHREWTPRKIDPAGIDMTWLRNMTGAHLGAGITPPPSEEDDMTTAQANQLTEVTTRVQALSVGKFEDLRWLEDRIRGEVARQVDPVLSKLDQLLARG